MPKAFSEQEKEFIRQRLLEQGDKFFSTYGLKKTNVDEIARAAGISKGAFYNFYESKEALFLEVIEQVEVRLRQEILAAIDLPGPSPRARLAAALIKAFALFESIPILRFLTGSDYDLLFRRIPAERMQQHLGQDEVFLEELYARCRQTGIPIQVSPEQLAGLMYPLVVAVLYQGNVFGNQLHGNFDLLLELVAAYCLGEIELEQPAGPALAGGEK